MSAKPLPPDRPSGVIDLLGMASGEGTPRNGVPDASWRADALGRSRHSRLADELRAPLDDPDPARAELVCARITREALRDYAPALLLLARRKRRRAQALTAWTMTLFDLALRPGFAGLDGDRLAQINAWEFRTEEALDGNPPGQPVFVMMARENEVEAWPREALDRIVAAARKVGVGPAVMDVVAAEAILEVLFGETAKALAPLLAGAIEPGQSGSIEAVRAVDVSNAPRGWRRAASYVKRARLVMPSTAHEGIGLGHRLRLLVTSAMWPR